MRSRSRVAAALALAVAIAGCGGGGGDADPAAKAVKQASDNLSKIHSGRMDFRFTLSPHGDAGKGAVGVELSGPFAAAEGSGLPQLEMTYTRLAGTQRSEAQIVSTGDAAFVVSDGRTVRLTSAQSEPLRGALSSKAGLGGLGVDPSRWISGAKLSDGPTVDGAKTDRVTGKLRAGAALKDLAQIAKRSGGAAVSDADVERLDKSVSSSSVEVVVGQEDHLLRALTVRMSLELPPKLRSRVPGAGGVDAELVMRIGKPNSPVKVGAPAGA
jgi:hypothetical protein